MNPPPPPPSSKTEILDVPLHLIGFEFDQLSAQKVTGHLLVTSKCCQVFGVLHGGVSAMIAEALASHGAVIASGFNRVAGIELSINHLKPAVVGDMVVAEATPINVGKSIQVWDVRLSKCDPSNSEIKTPVSFSRVTMFCKFPASESARVAFQKYKRFAKL